MAGLVRFAEFAEESYFSCPLCLRGESILLCHSEKNLSCVDRISLFQFGFLDFNTIYLRPICAVEVLYSDPVFIYSELK